MKKILLINSVKKPPTVFIEKNPKDKKSSIEKTLSAMKTGAEQIYQAAIKKDNIFGYADLLVKKKGRSLWGKLLLQPL